MRQTYKLAFGKEYDSPERKQQPLPIKLAYEVALRRINKKLEYLRSVIKSETISYGEIAELQSLAEYIEPSDVLLLEWAGVRENE